MTRYQFELAKPTDDAGLRKLMSETPMPGDVAITLERKPNYFLGNRVFGPDCQTIVCRDQSCGEIVGVATRSVRMLYVNAVPTRIGYLSGLRLADHVRSTGVLARGFRFLRELHESDANPPAYYLTTIANGNEIARRALTSGRAGLPTYHPLGALNTFAVARRVLRSNKIAARASGDDDLVVTSLADEPTTAPWLAFINEIGRRKTFFPVYDESDLHSATGTFHGLDFASIVVVRRKQQIVATAGVWDQSAFRQSVVRDYRTPIRIARHLLNVWALLVGNVTLPAIGAPISAAYVSLLAIRDDDTALLRTLLCELANRCETDIVLIGQCDNDPVISSCSRLSRLRYRTYLYAVNWDWDESLQACPMQDPFYLELGCL